jgi:lysozyme
VNLEALRTSLINHEGWRNLPYEDSLGFETIGVGHLLSNPLSKVAISQILDDDINSAIAHLERYFKDWRSHSDARQNVLIEMMFNMGARRLGGFKLMWAALERQDYPGAAREMRNSQWARQVHGRAETLAKIMENG